MTLHVYIEDVYSIHVLQASLGATKTSSAPSVLRSSSSASSSCVRAQFLACSSRRPFLDFQALFALYLGTPQGLQSSYLGFRLPRLAVEPLVHHAALAREVHGILMALAAEQEHHLLLPEPPTQDLAAKQILFFSSFFRLKTHDNSAKRTTFEPESRPSHLRPT